MDEAQLKKIVENIGAPEPDENAKKRAINLAMAEFQAHQSEKKQKSEKTFQGFGILSRLMGKTNPQTRRDIMEQKTRKNLYRGTAMAALALALLATPAINGYIKGVVLDSGIVDIEEVKKEKISRKPMANNIGTISMNIGNSSNDVSWSDIIAAGKSSSKKKESRVDDVAEAPASTDVSQSYRTAIKTTNKQRTEHAAQSAQSNVPMPIGAPKGAIAGRAMEQNLQNHFVASPPVLADVDMIAFPQQYDEGRDKFEDFEINPIKLVQEEPVSTFSVDVDTASYSFVRRQLNSGRLPQKNAVRVEELVNYFDYDYAVPETRENPFQPTVAVTDSPWAEGKKLMHIGVKGYEITGEKPKSNLVFLLDVSGSMRSQDKLPLVKNSMKMMLDNLNPDDTVSIVVYAGAAGAVLEPTKVSERSKIMSALDRLQAGGSTAGAAGINLAYQLAQENFDDEGVNRVILATDGDFNVGITNREELKSFVERKRKSGIFLSVLGFGQGNYNDSLMQTLAQNGNGIAAYIDNLKEARKVLVEEATSSLFTIAKDVKIQVEFNPAQVAEYRLIGYETRHLNREDFNNDKVDAGDIGAGHTVTAIYEVTPTDSPAARSVDPLRYDDKEVQEAAPKIIDEKSAEYAFLKIRYKLPDGDKSTLMTTPIMGDADVQPAIMDDVNFATAVAAFGQKLKGGKYVSDYSYDEIIKLANQAKGKDDYGHRAEFVQLVRAAQSLDTMKTQ